MATTPEAVGPVLLLGSVESDHTTKIRCFVINGTLLNQALELIGKAAQEDNDAETGDSDIAVNAAVDSVANDEEAEAA